MFRGSGSLIRRGGYKGDALTRAVDRTKRETPSLYTVVGINSGCIDLFRTYPRELRLAARTSGAVMGIVRWSRTVFEFPVSEPSRLTGRRPHTYIPQLYWCRSLPDSTSTIVIYIPPPELPESSVYQLNVPVAPRGRKPFASLLARLWLTKTLEFGSVSDVHGQDTFAAYSTVVSCFQLPGPRPVLARPSPKPSWPAAKGSSQLFVNPKSSRT